MMSSVESDQSSLKESDCSSRKDSEENSNRTNGNFVELVDELMMQNLAREMLLKIGLERENLKYTILMFQIENAKKDFSKAENTSRDMRKILVETQTEMNQINEEIVKQEEMIENICSHDRMENFSKVMEAVSHAVEEYHMFKSVLETEIQSYNGDYTEIEEMKEDITKKLNFVIYLEEQRQGILDQVESKLAELETLNVVSDENVKRLEKEFAKCLTLKKELLALQVQKENIEGKWKANMENRKRIEENTRYVTKWYNDLNTTYLDEFKNLSAENHVIADDLEKLRSVDTDQYDEIRLMLCTIKRELNDLRKYNELLKAEKSEFAIAITLQHNQIRMRQDEVQIKRDIKEILETGKKMNEYAMCNAQYQLNVLESYIAKVKNQFKTLNEEISLLEVEYQAYSHLTNEEAEIETSWSKLQKDLENYQQEFVHLQSEKNHMQKVVEKLTTVEAQLVSKLETSKPILEKLERFNRETEKILTEEIEEENQKINVHYEDINASAIIEYEEDLLLDALREDLKFYEEEHAEKQFELWNFSRENEKKSADYHELRKKLIIEEHNLEMLRNLVYDLEKNTIPNKDIPDTWFQSFEIEKKKFKIMHKQRVELEKKREYLLEQVEKYEYRKYKARVVNESMSNLDINDSDNKKKNNKNRTKKKN